MEGKRAVELRCAPVRAAAIKRICRAAATRLAARGGVGQGSTAASHQSGPRRAAFNAQNRELPQTAAWLGTALGGRGRDASTLAGARRPQARDGTRLLAGTVHRRQLRARRPERLALASLVPTARVGGAHGSRRGVASATGAQVNEGNAGDATEAGATAQSAFGSPAARGSSTRATSPALDAALSVLKVRGASRYARVT